MAFIVPVVKKDFVLYNSVDRKKIRASSNPIELRKKCDSTPKLSRLSHSIDAVGTSSPTTKSAPVTPARRRSHRISIRRINSESENLDCPRSAPPNIAGRHVRFGFLEEIEYTEVDEQVIDDEPYAPAKPTAMQSCLKMPTRYCALEATTPPFKKNAMLKLVTFCSSKN